MHNRKRLGEKELFSRQAFLFLTKRSLIRFEARYEYVHH